MGRQPLGRGLSALLGDQPAGEGTLELGLDQIEPNSEQPRTRFTDKALDELAQSIKANGIVQPIVVRRIGPKYQIVAGERRWRAAQRAGLHKIPAVIKEVSDEKLLELALVENIQRQELNAVEEARAYRKLIDTIGLTQESVAERVGKERSLIATSLRLLKLPDDILKFIEEEKLTAGHGRALLMAQDADSQRRITKAIIDKSLSVREAEKAVKRSNRIGSLSIDTIGVTAKKDPNLVSAETKLRRKLGTNVNIIADNKGGGGKVEIEYYSEEDLNRIYQVIIRSKA
ncbi:MAG: ParB/RepB/Spo0J family partition protein [Pyrinomonadaceae bacterium]|nr:ParB/RepB/Spo0J family partition protein [Blastocatellia bacterium]MDQ3490012.1 ParB/RepB/Spo0J family partition protein [Acidobacteriota bacterium]